MVTNRDFRSFIMDALSATTTFAGGLARALSPAERHVTKGTAPSLNESRFWVVGRRHSAADHDVLAWSPVRQIAKALAHLAVAFGLVDVVVVDCETDREEQIDKAA